VLFKFKNVAFFENVVIFENDAFLKLNYTFIYNTPSYNTPTHHTQSDMASENIEELNQKFAELSHTHQDLQVNYMRLSLDYKQSKCELYIAYKTIATLQETLKQQAAEMQNLEATFSLITDELKNNYEAERKQVVSEYIEQLHRSDQENEQLKNDLQNVQMQTVELNASLRRERQHVDDLDNDIKILTTTIEKMQDVQYSGPIQIQIVPAMWSCLLCYEEKTPTCDAVICPNAQCNKRICRVCVGKIESEDDCVQCPYCRLEYKISMAQDRENYKIEIFKLHAKCAELNKIIAQFRQATEPAAAAHAVAHNADDVHDDVHDVDLAHNDVAHNDVHDDVHDEDIKNNQVESEIKLINFTPQIILFEHPKMQKILTWYVEKLTEYIAWIQHYVDQLPNANISFDVCAKWLLFIENSIMKQSGFPNWIAGVYNAKYTQLKSQL
jgi:hypothetical protein